MEIQALIKEAYQKDSEFRFKWDYWCTKRQKAPTLDWLMPLLENALGRSYVREAASQYIDKHLKVKDE